MSLSQRFEKAEKVTQPSSKPSRSVSLSSQPPRVPKGGVKKVQRKNDKQNKSNQSRGHKGQKPRNRQNGSKPAPTKRKTQEELDAELDMYTMGKEAYLQAKLDAELQSYHAQKDQEATSSSEPAATSSS